MQKSSKILSGWSWKKADDAEWHPCRHDRPISQIHPDLADAGIIKNPHLGLVETDVQWVGEQDWEYHLDFDCTENQIAHTAKCLVIESLDPLATVYLNNTKILTSENAFHTHRIDVSHVVVQGTNEVRINFESLAKYGDELAQQHAPLSAWNGRPSRLYVRKPQYQWGWDWGPTLLTAGPSRRLSSHLARLSLELITSAIVFESYDECILDAFVDVDVTEDLDANVDVVYDTTSSPSSQVLVERYLDGKLLDSHKACANDGHAKFTITKPELWYPHRYGQQPLHTIKITLLTADGKILDMLSRQVGFRRARLVQRSLDEEPGTTFLFEINNIPIFCCGSNWIPAHSFETLLLDADYEDWVKLAKEGNQDMLRVWGGGMFEPDAFYEACDKQGMLVWQDFMFACGQYPCTVTIANSVQKEAESQLRRLRNRCSVVIYAGNNEDYQLAESLDLEWDKEDHSGKYMKTNFPARTLYERTLPEAVQRICPRVPYHPGSPWGGKDTRDPTEGDIHQWEVWHGQQRPYQEWHQLSGRFVSEFGMQAMPCQETVDAFVGDDRSENYPQSKTVEFHNKADSWTRRLALYVMENVRLPSMDMIDWIYATQLMQSDCLSLAYRQWRRKWKGKGKEETAGALVWQLNDCWPGISWSIVDFYKRPKPAYYGIKRESASTALGITRRQRKDGQISVEAWVSHAALFVIDLELHIEAFDIATGESISRATKHVRADANGCTEFGDYLDMRPCKPIVIRGMIKHNSRLLSTCYDWPQPLKHLHISKRQVDVRIDGNTVTLSSTKPIKGATISVTGCRNAKVFFEDNCVDLCPGESTDIRCRGLRANDEVQVQFYGQN